MAATIARKMVSKKKIRFHQDGFDLDLTYITDRIIAMGFPSEGSEAVYRNPRKEVQRFFRTRHTGHYKLYNLCSEREYDPGLFEGQVERFPFDDHNAPSLRMLVACCESVKRWLDAHPSNVAAIHCKAGKGRTGCVISAFLIYSGLCADADSALALFASKRTANSKGVTIPSQRRYVRYMEHYVKNFHSQRSRAPFDFTGQPLKITSMRINTVPNFDPDGGSDPYFKLLSFEGTKVGDSRTQSKPLHIKPGVDAGSVITGEWPVRGDVKVRLYDWDRLSGDDAMCHFWFNTSFIADNYVQLKKLDLDKACKDTKNKHFQPEFSVEIWFEPGPGGPPPAPSSLQVSAATSPAGSVRSAASSAQSSVMQAGFLAELKTRQLHSIGAAMRAGVPTEKRGEYKHTVSGQAVLDFIRLHSFNGSDSHDFAESRPLARQLMEVDALEFLPTAEAPTAFALNTLDRQLFRFPEEDDVAETDDEDEEEGDEEDVRFPANASDLVWYYTDSASGSAIGYVSAKKLYELWNKPESRDIPNGAATVIHKDTNVWNGGSVAEWVPISTVGELSWIHKPPVRKPKAAAPAPVAAVAASPPPSSDVPEWYYTDKSGASVGPVPASALQTLWREGMIHAESFVWHPERSANWTRIASVAELAWVAPGAKPARAAPQMPMAGRSVAGEAAPAPTAATTAAVPRSTSPKAGERDSGAPADSVELAKLRAKLASAQAENRALREQLKDAETEARQSKQEVQLGIQTAQRAKQEAQVAIKQADLLKKQLSIAERASEVLQGKVTSVLQESKQKSDLAFAELRRVVGAAVAAASAPAAAASRAPPSAPK